MQFACGSRELSHQRGNAVGGGGVFLRGADVGQRLARCVVDGVDVRFVKHRAAQLRVIAQQGMKLPAVGVQQGGASYLCALLGGDEVDFGGSEGTLAALPGCHAQGVQGFSDDLGREAGDGQEDAAGVGHGRAAALSFQWRR